MFWGSDDQMSTHTHTDEQYSNEDLDEEPDEGVVGHAVVHDSTKRRIHRDRTGHRWWGIDFDLGDDEQTHVYILEELLDSKSHLLGSIWNMMMMIILMLVMMMMVVVVKKDG